MVIKSKSFDLAEKKFFSKQKGIWLARPEYEYEFIGQYFKKYNKILHTVPEFNVDLLRLINSYDDDQVTKSNAKLVYDDSYAGFLNKDIDRIDAYNKDNINTPNLEKYIKPFKNTKKRFTLFTTRTAYRIDNQWYSAHSLAIIYDKKYHELDIFNVNPDNINEFKEITSLLFKRIYGKSLKIVFPDQEAPFYNLFSTCQKRKNGLSYEFSSDGFCVPATLWYFELRLSNPKLTRTEIYKKIIKNVKDQYHLCDIYLGYAQFIQRTINKYDYKIDDKTKTLTIKDKKTNKTVIVSLILAGLLGFLGLVAYGIKKLKNKKSL